MNYKLFDVDEDEVPRNMQGILLAVTYIDCGFCYYSNMQCPGENNYGKDDDLVQCKPFNRKDNQEVMFIHKYRSIRDSF